jgi:hypothetical protein
LIDGAQESRTIGCEVVRRAVVRGDHRGKIPGAELLDGRRRDLPGGDRRLADRDGAIHQNDHEPPFVVGHLIGGHVGRDVANPGGSDDRAAGKVNLAERLNRTRRPFFEDREVGRGQAADGAALVVEDGDVELDEIGPRPKRRLWLSSVGPLGKLLGAEPCRRGDERGRHERAR